MCHMRNALPNFDAVRDMQRLLAPLLPYWALTEGASMS